MLKTRNFLSSCCIINPLKNYYNLNSIWQGCRFSTSAPLHQSLDDKFQFHQYFGMANEQIKDNNLIEALENYRKALEILEKPNTTHVFTSDQALTRAEIYLRKGTIFYSSKNPKDAMRSFQKAKELFEDHPGYERIIAECAENIASIYLDQGIYREALTSFEESLLFFKQLSDDINCAKILYKMSLAYTILEEREMTLEKLTSSFNTLANSNIVYNEEISDLYFAIGQAFIVNQEYQKSIDALNKGLRIKIELCGENHLDLGIYYSILGEAYSTLLMNSEALKMFLKSLELKKKALGKSNIELIETYINIADLHLKEGDLEKSLQNYKLALKSTNTKKIKSIVYPYIYYKIGVVNLDTNDVSEAIKHFRKAIDVYSPGNTNNEVSLSDLYEILGLSYCMLQNYAQARDYYNQALKLVTYTIGSTNKDTFHLNLTLGSINCELNSFEEAIKYYKAAEDQIQSMQGESSSLGYIYHGFANVYYKQTLIKQAVQYYKSAVEILNKELMPKNIYFANLYRDFGTALCQVDENAEAIENFNKGMEVAIDNYGVGHPDILKFVKELKRLYERTNNLEQIYKLEKFFNL